MHISRCWELHIIMGRNLENCPYCNGKLESGTLISYRYSFFLPEGAEYPWVYSDRALQRSNAIELVKMKWVGSTEYPVSFVCRKCGLIIIPYGPL